MATTRSSRAGKGTPRLGTILSHVVLIAISVVALYPIYYMVITAFKSREEYLSSQFLPPLHPTLQNLRDAIAQGDLLQWMLNSVIVTAVSVLAATAAAVLAAYALARMRFPGRDTILSGIVSLMVVPPVVLVVPLFLLMVRVGLISTLPSVIVVYVGLTIPLSVYLLTNFFRALPYEIEEAARIDGCSPLGRSVAYCVAPLRAGLVDLYRGQRLLGVERTAYSLGLPPEQREPDPGGRTDAFSGPVPGK